MRAHALLTATCLCLPVSAMAQDKATIQSLNDQFAKAFNAGDTAAVAAHYTEDAVVLPPGAEMVMGRNAILTFWKSAADQIGDIKLTAVDVKPLGSNAAREIGTFSLGPKGRNRSKSPASMWWSGRRSGETGSSRPTSGTRTNSLGNRLPNEDCDPSQWRVS